MHMREALCEALHLRGALHDREQFVDKFEARNVLSDVVTRALAIFCGDLMPRIGVNISPETIALVRDRTDIVAVITEAVPSLKRRGRSFVGLCPFHKEKTPSFHVNQDRGFFHCFGSR